MSRIREQKMANKILAHKIPWWPSWVFRLVTTKELQHIKGLQYAIATENDANYDDVNAFAKGTRRIAI